ncbi:MAG: SDR family NAD(P)-dependent oxidoreductase [Gammaproteobacteria bacterium]|nr:SDR family NAD(P)-dependent oxidoreductase [Gammaproteobacteria bacterium]
MFVITGGGRGLGRALALALAERDHAVLIIGRSEQHLKATAACSPLIEYICADVSTDEGRSAVVSLVAAKSMIQGLIHNAGVIEPIAKMQDVNRDAWRACLTTNLEAPLFLTQALLPYLTSSRVLHIGSGAAYFPVSGWSAYCVSKAGLSMLTRCWQLENPALVMTSVMPGIIDTDMVAMIRAATEMDDEKLEFFVRLKEKEQLVTPETVAHFLSWLLCDVSIDHYVSKEWDIYDTAHHSQWLRAPHVVPVIEG